MRHPDRRQHAGDAGPLLRGRLGEAPAKRLAARVDADLPPGLRIDEPDLADVRELLLAWVANLDRDHVMAAQQLKQRLAPVERAAKVGDDDDDAALARDRRGVTKRRA